LYGREEEVLAYAIQNHVHVNISSMLVTGYLSGVCVALILLIKLWGRQDSQVTLIGIICGLLSCFTSWIAAGLFIYVFYKPKKGECSKNNKIPLI